MLSRCGHRSHTAAAAAIAAITVTLLPGVVRADLPVHCLHHEIVGEWRFTLGPLAERRTSCGHARPDAEDQQPMRSFLDTLGNESQLMVSLKEPNVVESARDETGTWTMVYDEGFEVKFGKLNFFAFSNFTFVQDDSTHFSKQNVSHCGETMVG